MKLNRPSFIICCLCLLVFARLHGQEKSNYYAFPIQPGKQNYLAGTMGELRANHFHAGIDIKTNQVEGLPVYAAADGYISRIKTSTWGYGNVIYIAHPNQTTTVYAHLREFKPALEHHMLEAQYQREQFEVELFPKKEDFPVKKGEIIAYSGNTGGSMAPHLHFEIRDANHRPLDPLQYKFSEIKDTTPPTAEKIAFVTLEKDARVNGIFGRQEFNLTKGNDGNFKLSEPVHVHGKIGLEVLAHDKLDGVPNKNGIACIEMNLDNDLVFSQTIENYTFAESRQILVLYNYETSINSGQRFNKLYQDDGNSLPFYNRTQRRGMLSLSDSLQHNISISLADSYQNSSTIDLQLNLGARNRSQDRKLPFKGTIGLSLLDNTLLMYCKGQDNAAPMQLHTGRRVINLQPAYHYSDANIYLWDLRRGLPDSAMVCDDKLPLNFKALVPSVSEFSYFGDQYALKFPRNALYDTLYLRSRFQEVPEKGGILSVEGVVPMQKAAYFTMKALLNNVNKEKAAVYRMDKYGGLHYEGGKWEGDKITFSTRSLGDYLIASDTLAPEITPISLSSEKVSFVIQDDLSGISSFRAEINGQWLLMQHDYKRNLIFSERKDKTVPLAGNFKLVVTDNAGNKNEFTTKL